VPDNLSTPPKRKFKPGTFHRIAGGVFALIALLSAIGGSYALTAIYFALCAVFLALGTRKAREARASKDAADTEPKP
jgi:hypothetical protein